MRAFRAAGLAAVLVAGVALAAWWSGERELVDEVALARASLGIPLESRRIDVGAIALHTVLAGPERGDPVLLIHGFPELWWTWTAQIERLARAGFRVAAPDLRGYNRSDKPPDPADYARAALAGDMLGLLDALGWRDAYVAGHDVGAGVTWHLVFAAPRRVRGAVVFNIGHPSSWARARPGDDPETISWFRSFFRLPLLPELVGRAGDYWLLARNLRQTARPGTFDDETLDVFKSAWARDGALSTMLGTYRAPPTDYGDLIPDDGRPSVPVQLVYGVHDAFIPRETARITREYLGYAGVLEVEDAGHWILLEEPRLTSEILLRAFGG